MHINCLSASVIRRCAIARRKLPAMAETATAHAGFAALSSAPRSDCRHLLLGIAGWMRYILGEDEKGERYPVADPLVAKFERINQQFPSGPARVQALLGINEIFADDLPANPAFVAALQHP